MPTATHAANENARLNVLHDYDVLDQQFDATFDRFARMASSVADAPIGLVSFAFGERQLFRGTASPALRAFPRNGAFCNHVMDSDDVLIVPNATRDVRFADNPLVLGETHVRFFAGAPILSKDGLRLGTVCVFDTVPRTLSGTQATLLRDLAASVTTSLELYKSMRDVRDLAMTDSLTGVGNRAHFHDALRRETVRARRNHSPLSLLYLDCDGFSAINNTLGHAAGDQLLREISAVMRDHLRGSDTLGRLGGDEFALILPETGQAAARATAERILATWRRLVVRYEHPISASVGVATFLTVPDDVSTILEAADCAMYQAKHAGRDRISAVVVRADVRLGVVATAVREMA